MNVVQKVNFCSLHAKHVWKKTNTTLPEKLLTGVEMHFKSQQGP